jgi:phosphatidylserine decarboxylase
MKWNKFLQRNVSVTERTERPYIDYKQLKQLIKNQDANIFVDNVLAQLNRVNNYTTTEQQTIMVVEDNEELHKLHQYVQVNVTSVQKIVKKWKKKNPMNLLPPSLETRMEQVIQEMIQVMTMLTSQICSLSRSRSNSNSRNSTARTGTNTITHMSNISSRSTTVLYICSVVFICMTMAAVLYQLTASAYVVLAATSTLLLLLLPFVLLVNGSSSSRSSITSSRKLSDNKLPIVTYERLMYLLSWNVASYVWGKIHHITLPMWAREPMYMAWTLAFKCNLDEMRYGLKSYRCLGDFFSRPLKDDMRPIHQTSPIVSPVDGTVYSCVKIENAREKLDTPIVNHVKGLNYSLRAFLGKRSNLYDQAEPKNKTCLYQCVIYLAPGDYHRIHSSSDWTITRRKHFPGALLPVNPVFVKYVNGLFAVNERIVIEGTWNANTIDEQQQQQEEENQKYFFSLSAVGAYNVGSIELNFDTQVVTNEKPHKIAAYVPKYPDNPDADSEKRCPNRTCTYDRIFPSGIHVQRGEEIAKFKLGSTVVLIFEAPEDLNLQFAVKSGQKVRMGQTLLKQQQQ